MRLLALVAVLSALSIGGVGLHRLLQPVAAANPDFSTRYRRLAEQSPDRLIGLLQSALPQCLPANARPLVQDTAVAELAAKTLFRSGLVMAEGKSAEQGASELIPWLSGQAKSLTGEQRDAYLDLLKTGLNRPETTVCVLSAARSTPGSGLGVETAERDLTK